LPHSVERGEEGKLLDPIRIQIIPKSNRPFPVRRRHPQNSSTTFRVIRLADCQSNRNEDTTALAEDINVSALAQDDKHSAEARRAEANHRCVCTYKEYTPEAPRVRHRYNTDVS